MEEDKEDFQEAGEDGTAHTYGDMNLISSHKSKEELLSDLAETDNDNEKGFGDENLRTTFSLHGDKSITLEDFEIKSVLGKGTFGKVFLTVLKKSGSLYAIKSI